eukprot:482533_1
MLQWKMFKLATIIWFIVVICITLWFKYNNYNQFNHTTISTIINNNNSKPNRSNNNITTIKIHSIPNLLPATGIFNKLQLQYKYANKLNKLNKFQNKKQTKNRCDYYKLPPKIVERKLSFSLSLPINMTSNRLHFEKTSIPSLVLIAPPKSGTTSFVYTMSRYPNIIRYGRQNLYWQERCITHDTTNDWKQYLNMYLFNKVNLSNIIDILQFDNNGCTIGQYESNWNSMYKKRSHCYNNSICIYPYRNDIINNISSNIYCYLIEKAPCYANTPWIPILYANLMPKIKLLNIIRNPSTHILSATYAFNGGVNKMNISVVKYNIINKLKKLNEFKNMSIECMNINKEWELLKNKDAMNRYLIMKERIYKHLKEE